MVCRVHTPVSGTADPDADSAVVGAAANGWWRRRCWSVRGEYERDEIWGWEGGRRGVGGAQVFFSVFFRFFFFLFYISEMMMGRVYSEKCGRVLIEFMD